MRWFLITTESGQGRINRLLQELNIGLPVNPLFYIQLGYKNLSTQDKETYYLIKNLSNLNKDNICKIGLDFLAIALNTTETTQANRLKNLQKYKLIKILKDNSYYILNSPYPDTTFLHTLIQLIRRKQLNSDLCMYKTCNNPMKRMDYIKEIKKILLKDTKHYKASQFMEDTIDEDLLTALASINIIKNSN